MDKERSLRLYSSGKDKDYFTHCSLERKVENGVQKRVIWGSSDKAVVGKFVKVEEEDGTWTHGWQVVSVHGEPQPKSYCNKLAHAHTKQRKASDI